VTQYQAAHVDGAYRVYATETGIDRTYFDQPFRKPRAAIAYSDELAGLPGRHPSPDLARDRISTASRDEVAVPIEAPDRTQDVSSAPGTCAVCGGALPPGSRPQRRTCSGACRVALARGRVAVEANASPVTVSEASEARPAVPTSPADPGGYALPGSAEDAGPDLSPGHRPAVLSLGL